MFRCAPQPARDDDELTATTVVDRLRVVAVLVDDVATTDRADERFFRHVLENTRAILQAPHLLDCQMLV